MFNTFINIQMEI